MRMPLLRFKYLPGEERTYVVETHTTRVTTQVDKVLEQQEQKILTHIKLRCLNVEGDRAYLILAGELKEFLLRGDTSDGAHIDYKASQEELAKASYKVYVTFNDRGKVLEMIGGNDVPALVLPEKEVEVGDSWQENVNLNLPMLDEPVTLQLIYKLEDMRGNVAVIGLESKERSINVPINLTLDNQERNYIADYLIRLSGKFEFDIDRGVLVNHKLLLETTVKMDVYIVELNSTSKLSLLTELSVRG